jgi:nucleoside-diphosphate-sugar epimerase
LAGRGGRRQDFVDVRDCGEAVRLCLDKGATGVLNIAAGASVSNLELANTCTAVLGSSSAVEFTGRDDPEEEMRWEIDISRARAVVGFTPAHSLEDSIRAVAEDNADRAHQ